MTEEELRKNYYADRPSEPYSDDDRPSDWANIAHYAEENLENAFKRIEELGKENAELKVGRPEWHKVADGDLPKTEDLEMQVLCFTHDGYQLLSLFSDPEPIFKGYGVIAWCEIPKYTEE